MSDLNWICFINSTEGFCTSAAALWKKTGILTEHLQIFSFLELRLGLKKKNVIMASTISVCWNRKQPNKPSNILSDVHGNGERMASCCRLMGVDSRDAERSFPCSSAGWCMECLVHSDKLLSSLNMLKRDSVCVCVCAHAHVHTHTHTHTLRVVYMFYTGWLWKT